MIVVEKKILEYLDKLILLVCLFTFMFWGAKDHYYSCAYLAVQVFIPIYLMLVHN